MPGTAADGAGTRPPRTGGRGPDAPRAGIRPAATTALMILALLCGASLPSATALAETRLLRPLDDAAAALAALRPGDELLLDDGLFGPLDLAALRGTAEAPIVIRGRATGVPATIRAGEYGLRLAGAQHLVIEDIAIAGARTAAVLIDAAPGDGAGASTPARDLHLRRVTALRPEALSCDSIRIVGAERVTLSQLHLEQCGATGISLEDARTIVITESMLIGRTTREPVGIRIASTCAEITVRGCSFAGGFSSGVVLGTARSGSIAETITIERCGFVRNGAAWTLAAVRNARIRHCTVSGPEGALFRVDAVAGEVTRSAVLSDNLFHWLPNDLTSLAAVAPGVDTSFIELRQNLWWAADFAAAPTALGPFPGRIVEPQILEVDPRLDDADRPFNPEATRFGRHAAAVGTASGAPPSTPRPAQLPEAVPTCPPAAPLPPGPGDSPAGNGAAPTVSSLPRTP